jgi:hypothetical protein
MRNKYRGNVAFNTTHATLPLRVCSLARSFSLVSISSCYFLDLDEYDLHSRGVYTHWWLSQPMCGDDDDDVFHTLDLQTNGINNS